VDALKGQVLTINKRDRVLTISAPYKPAWMPLRSRAVMIPGERQTVSIAGKTVTEPLDALLDKGVLTLDFARTNTFFETYEAFAGIEKPQPVEKAPVEEGLITHLNRKAFLRDVFDFRQYDEWNYQGDMPCVIDFWATWCIPCRRLAPIIKELSEQYEGRVKFYKINVDEEKEISAGYFDIGAIPVLVFVPLNGEPVKTLGVDSKSDIEEKIERVLLRD
jgi:thioredoxin